MNEKEKTIITLLKEGYSQAEITNYFRESKDFKIGSQSTVEKSIKRLKKLYGVKSLFQLGIAVESRDFI
jgi:hypothetical protein